MNCLWVFSLMATTGELVEHLVYNWIINIPTHYEALLVQVSHLLQRAAIQNLEIMFIM
jgi:hypothetical protein